MKVSRATYSATDMMNFKGLFILQETIIRPYFEPAQSSLCL